MIPFLLPVCVEAVYKSPKLHIVNRGAAAPQQLQEMQEKVSFASDPQRSVVRVAVLLDRAAEEVFDERVVEEMGVQLESLRLLLIRSNVHPYVAFSDIFGEALRPAE